MRKIDLLEPGLDGDCNVVKPMTRTVAVTDDPQIGPALQYGHSQFTSIRAARAGGAGAPGGFHLPHSVLCVDKS